MTEREMSINELSEKLWDLIDSIPADTHECEMLMLAEGLRGAMTAESIALLVHFLD